MGRSVGISRISRVKKVSKSNRPRIDRILRSDYTLSVRRTCPLKLLKLKRNLPFSRLTVTIAYFFGESYHGRSFGWRATATSKANLPVTDMGLKERTQTAWRSEEAHPRKARTLLEDLEKQKGRLPPGEEVTGSICLLPFENGFFFQPTEAQSRTKFLHGVMLFE